MKSARKSGFTLIEMLVALTIFSVVIGAGLNLLIAGIATQKGALAQQKLVDETSFVLEYMSRALRQAQVDTLNDCIGAPARNYELFGGNTGVRFIDGSQLCREIFLQNGQLLEKISTDHTFGNLPVNGEALTSNDLSVESISFSLTGDGGADNLQPRLVISLYVKGLGPQDPSDQPTLRLQTTLSQRRLDL
ncbi:MAG: type II secretion system protein [Candidatus Wildermuthbacteria bacterium]|nr:type II secretion system protein [Candidatus Wildermuthbacteria bacterium]